MPAALPWEVWCRALRPVLESIFANPTFERSCPRFIASTTTRLCLPRRRPFHSSNRRLTNISTSQANSDARKDTNERRTELDRSGIPLYPRALENCPNLSLKHFGEEYGHIQAGETEQQVVTVVGRVSASRRAGGKLAFLDIREQPGDVKLQAVLNLSGLKDLENSANARSDFSDRIRLIQRGDVISVRGYPHRTKPGEISVLALELPRILTPCLHNIPTTSYHEDSDLALDRHVDMLTSSDSIANLVARSKMLRTIRTFFESQSFVEVQTPILAAAAGGATARPFETSATEFSDRKLALRIAPELWLKRLVIGGMPRIFEIGQCFRNEGLDKTHNPEFTTCEFYAVYHDLTKLQRITEQLLHNIASALRPMYPDTVDSVIPRDNADAPTFKEIDFIPALNAAIGSDLPKLSSPDSRVQILDIFRSKSIPLPLKPTLPRLLDKLCSIYLEPQCTEPTWVINTPECLSPLAKSFIHPTAPNDQAVAARAELFIQGKEVVNCYEEENNPSEQRRKFIEQQIHARVERPSDSETGSVDVEEEDDEAMKLDEDYLRALEWGLPPTGGWGCGIDRLVMLFTGKDRIGDVLSFGNLRAVTRGAERWAVKKDGQVNGTGKA